VTFDLSHVNLIINKDILVKNIQIFICFNYSLRFVSRAKTSKDKKRKEFTMKKKKKELENERVINGII